MSNENDELIHIAKYLSDRGRYTYLFLRKGESGRFAWFEKSDEKEKETDLSATNVEEAMRLAHKTWKNKSFRTLNCGFLYTLPERDEHGINALFYQMAASYSTPGGVFFNAETGHSCHVQNASQEALDMLKELRSNQKK